MQPESLAIEGTSPVLADSPLPVGILRYKRRFSAVSLEQIFKFITCIYASLYLLCFEPCLLNLFEIFLIY